MGIRSLISFGLLAFPVGVTVAVLVGLDAYRQSNGQQRLFVDNKVTTTTYCQKAYGISPVSNGEQYTLNPNQWGWNVGDPGNLCMNVTAFHNGTYLTNSSAPDFSVTWQYPQGPDTQPVHAFPNIKLDGGSTGTASIFPVEISTLEGIDVGIRWTYGVGSQSADVTDESAVTTAELNANVAVDMFVDSDATKAQSSTEAKFEVMVWLAIFGSSTEPIGFAQGPLATQVVNATTFSLYWGQNSLAQYVLTWVATGTQENFYGDLSPLVTTLPSISALSVAPVATDYLGYLGFGSETSWSNTNVTFHVPTLAMQVSHS